MIKVLKWLSIMSIIVWGVGCGSGGTFHTPGEEVVQESSTADNVVNPAEREYHAPIAQEQTVLTNEDETTVIYLNGVNQNLNGLMFEIIQQPLHGQLEEQGSVVRYTPIIDYNGQDHFIFVIHDGNFTSKEATVTIQINPVNDIPEPIGQTVTVANNDVKLIHLRAEDSDDDNLTYSIVDVPSHGFLYGKAPELTYVPAMGYPPENYIGEDGFTFSVSDGKDVSLPQVVKVIVTEPRVTEVVIEGTVTYDSVPVQKHGEGLEYNRTVAKSIKQAFVEILDAENQVLQTTTTDDNGSYRFSGVPAETEVKLRVYAKMSRTGTPSWNIKVLDNTHDFALYGIESSLISSGTQKSIRNLHASSGWDGTLYSEARAAAPFAIMDTLYHSMQMLLNVDENLSFPPLKVNWSPQNKPAIGSIHNGQIISTHYDNGNLYILGDANSDTDEYDRYVIAHEWGHYYEDKFSRTDSLGGTHEDGQFLDIRVAFSEGFGNAIAGIIHDDPHYYDTYGISQSMGWQMDMETGNPTNAGWYSEGSVQRILYDLYDDNSTDENLSLGFYPLHRVLTGAYKNTPAFTSLFSFITALKTENNNSREAIDRIVAQEGIAPIEDIYGENRTLLAEAYPYHDLIVGMPLNNVCTTNTYGDLGSRNKLSNHQYIKFTLARAGDYRIHVQRTNGTGSDPDFTLLKTVPFHQIGYAESPFDDLEEIIKSGLEEGEYLLDLSDWNTAHYACFDINITAIE